MERECRWSDVAREAGAGAQEEQIWYRIKSHQLL